MDFKESAHGHGTDGIVHDNMSKLGTTMGVTIVNNVAIGIFHYFVIKNIFFIFQVWEMFFVWKKYLK